MKKIKIIISLLIGIVIGSTLTAYAAYSYHAKEVEYTPENKNFNVNDVESALNKLYENVNYEEYTGNINIIPSEVNQTVNTKDKILKNNIVLEAIPNEYKKLPITTSAASNHIISGKTAYDNNGNLITGNISTTCVKGTYTKKANSQWYVDFGFEPSIYIMSWKTTTGTGQLLYDASVSNTPYMALYDNNTFKTYNFYTLNGSILTSDFVTTTNSYTAALTIDYIGCK